jgi:preprotein translocase subunit SecB
MAPLGPFDGPVPADMMKNVSEVIPRLEIRDIRLIGLTCRLKAVPPSDLAVHVDLGHEVKTDPIADNLLGVKVKFSLTVKSQAENSQDMLTLSATFQLTYEGENIRNIEEDKRLAFANVNAVFNAWPYLRELVQSISGRMAIPALVVPLLKILPRPIEEKTTPADTAQV